jgi:hypothetical protein
MRKRIWIDFFLSVFCSICFVAFMLLTIAFSEFFVSAFCFISSMLCYFVSIVCLNDLFETEKKYLEVKNENKN